MPGENKFGIWYSEFARPDSRFPSISVVEARTKSFGRTAAESSRTSTDDGVIEIYRSAVRRGELCSVVHPIASEITTLLFSTLSKCSVPEPVCSRSLILPDLAALIQFRYDAPPPSKDRYTKGLGFRFWIGGT